MTRVCDETRKIVDTCVGTRDDVDEHNETYSPVRHVLLNLGTIIIPTSVYSILLSYVGDISTLSTVDTIVTLLSAFIVANFIEYIMHRYPMHRPKVPLGRYMFKRHTGIHHRRYTSDDMAMNHIDDLEYIMLPSKKAYTFMVIMMLLSLMVYAVSRLEYMSIFGITLAIYFMLEEVLHTVFHVRYTWTSTSLLGRCLRRLSRTHTIHHDHKLMSKFNFNIAFPLADVVFGTYTSSRSSSSSSHHAM